MKHLYLSQTDRKLAGLCAGVAEYLDIDVTVVRLIVLVTTVFTGVLPGVFVYAVGVAVTPKKGDHHA